MKLNKYEQRLLNEMETALECVPGDCELEMDHIVWDSEDKRPDGWYAYKYNESRGEAVPINDFYGQKPLITDEEIGKHSVDVYKCFDIMNCYMCG